MQKSVVFIFANTSGAGSTNCKTLNHPESLQGIWGSKHKQF